MSERFTGLWRDRELRRRPVLIAADLGRAGALAGGALGGAIGLPLTLVVAEVGTLLGVVWLLLSPVRGVHALPDTSAHTPLPA